MAVTVWLGFANVECRRMIMARLTDGWPNVRVRILSKTVVPESSDWLLLDAVFVMENIENLQPVFATHLGIVLCGCASETDTRIHDLCRRNSRLLRTQEISEKSLSSADMVVAIWDDLRGSGETFVTRPDTALSQPERLICIGASTGGPEALSALLPTLSSDLSYAVVVAQHLLPEMLDNVIGQLQKVTPCQVVIGTNGQHLRNNEIVFIPSHKHGKVHRHRGKWVLELLPLDAIASPWKPSVDALFFSAAESGAEDCVGIILTGMGDDGAAGARALKQAGGLIVAQTSKSCVVDSMPAHVVSAGLADFILDPGTMGPLLTLRKQVPRPISS